MPRVIVSGYQHVGELCCGGKPAVPGDTVRLFLERTGDPQYLISGSTIPDASGPLLESQDLHFDRVFLSTDGNQVAPLEGVWKSVSYNGTRWTIIYYSEGSLVGIWAAPVGDTMSPSDAGTYSAFIGVSGDAEVEFTPAVDPLPQFVDSKIIAPVIREDRLIGGCPKKITTYRFEYLLEALGPDQIPLTAGDIIRIECIGCCESLEDRFEGVEQAAISAQNSAQQAEEAAASAEPFAQAAQQAASDAESFSSQAQGYAESSSESAQAAQQAASDANIEYDNLSQSLDDEIQRSIDEDVNLQSQIDATNGRVDVFENVAIPQTHIFPPLPERVGAVMQSPIAINPGVIWTGVIDYHVYDPAFPFRWMAFASLDHIGSGQGAYSGFRIYVSNSLEAGWQSWDETAVRNAIIAAGYSLPSSYNNGCIPIAGYPGSNSTDDEGEFFTVVFFKGQWFVYGHTVDLNDTTDQTQTQWVATGDDPFNLTFQSQILVPSMDDLGVKRLHNGYQVARVEGGKIRFYTGVQHDVGPIYSAIYESSDGIVLKQITSASSFRSLPTIFGHGDLEMVHTCPPFFWQGKWWGISNLRGRTTQGGVTTEDRIIMSECDEFGNPVSAPILLAEPTGGSNFDSHATLYFGCTTMVPETAEVWLFYAGRNSIGRNTMGAIKLKLNEQDKNPSHALSMDSAFEAAYASFDRWPKRQWPVLNRGSIVVEQNFLTTSLPDGWNISTPGSAVVDFDGIGGRGEARIHSPTTDFSYLRWTDMEIDLNNYDQVWFDLFGVRWNMREMVSSNDQFIFMDFAFNNALAGNTTTRGVRWMPRQHTMQRGVTWYETGGAVYNNDNYFDYYYYFERDMEPLDISLGVLRCKHPSTGTYHRYIEVWLNGELVRITPCDDILLDDPLCPAIGVRNRTLWFTRARLRLAPKQWQ